MSYYKNTFELENENFSWSIAYKYIREGARVLEIGCGNGNFGEALKTKKQCHVIGIEPDEGDAAKATKKLDEVIVDTIENAYVKLAAKKTKFDYVVFLDVIEHIPEPISILRQLRSIIRPDGGIIFSIPNMGHVSIRLMLLSGRVEYGHTGILDATHVHFYTDKEIERIFGEAGYSIKEIDGVVDRYTEPMVKRELKKIGLNSPSRELLETLQRNQGDIYQYIGLANPAGTIRASKLPKVSPNTKNIHDEDYERIIEDYQQKLTLANAKIEELHSQTALASRQINVRYKLLAKLKILIRK